MATLVLLRHGESAWNAADVFTGWIDVILSDRGKQQAHEAGQLLATRHFPDVVHTSVQTRATQTADLALAACGRSWIPVRRSWLLNSNHYGALQGRTLSASNATTAPRVAAASLPPASVLMMMSPSSSVKLTSSTAGSACLV